jgi:hypothetical protein
MHFFKYLATAAVLLTTSTAAAQQYSMLVNTTASSLDINELGDTTLVSYANSEYFRLIADDSDSYCYEGSIWTDGIKTISSRRRIHFHIIALGPHGRNDCIIFPGHSEAIHFAVPHAASVPPGGASIGFAFGADGYCGGVEGVPSKCTIIRAIG